MKTIIVEATVHPITSSSFVGDVFVENGKIKAIGKDLHKHMDLSEIAVVQAEQKHLYPGFIDAHTHLGLYDEGTGWAGNDANETVDPLTPYIRAIDGVYPLDKAFSEARESGVTTVQVMPGSANVIGGITSVIKTAGHNIEDMIVRHPAALKMALGENPKKIHSNDKSITRMGIAGMIRGAFIQEGKKIPNFYNEHIHMARQRKIPVRIHAHRADDILTAVRLAKEFNLDLRIEHCTEGHLVADELAGLNLAVSVGPTMTRRSKVELRNKSWEVYRKLVDKGVKVSITTDHPYTPIQYLNVCAALTVREGLTEQEALEGITINPAQNLGVEERVGSIECGKDADLVLWEEHPFHYTAKVLWTMINGDFVYKKKKG